MDDQQSLEGIVGVRGMTWRKVGHVACVGAGEIDDEGIEAKSQ